MGTLVLGVYLICAVVLALDRYSNVFYYLYGRMGTSNY